jgi:bacteriocin biosynthesis cyclodehydratase domain-containing protein
VSSFDLLAVQSSPLDMLALFDDLLAMHDADDSSPDLYDVPALQPSRLGMLSSNQQIMAGNIDSGARLRALFSDPDLHFPKRPCLIPDLTTFPMPDGLGIQFRGSETPVVLRGRDAEKACRYLLAQLDGTRTVEEVERHRPEELSATTLLKTLFLLHAKGLLSDEPFHGGSITLPDSVLQRQLLFWGRRGPACGIPVTGDLVQRRIETSVVTLIGSGVFGSAVFDLLARSGVQKITVMDCGADGFLLETVSSGLVKPSEAIRLQPLTEVSLAEKLARLPVQPDLVITATRNGAATVTRAINRCCLLRNWKWLRGNEDDAGFDVGPLVLPHESACSTCLEMREASASDAAIEQHLYQEHLAESGNAQGAFRGEAIVPATLAASWLVMEAIRVLSGAAVPTLVNRVLRIDPWSGSFRMHEALRVPRCLDCYQGQLPDVPERPPHG